MVKLALNVVLFSADKLLVEVDNAELSKLKLQSSLPSVKVVRLC